MASDLENTFGFELLFKASGGQIAKKEDVLILFVHWYFIKNGFKCLGIGDSKTIDSNETGSELLPDGWNQASNYTLRYIKEGKLYILMGVKSETDLLINLLKIEDHNVSNVQFPIETVENLQGPLRSLIPNYETILSKLIKDLVDPVYSRTNASSEVSTQTQSQSDGPRRDIDDDPLRVGPPRPAGSIQPGFPRGGPFNVGQDDLIPFRGGGGMLFDPFCNQRPRPAYPGLGVPGRLPPGAIPPGSRFDPFGPPDVDPPIPRARGPDPDHMPPPGYDDMFM